MFLSHSVLFPTLGKKVYLPMKCRRNVNKKQRKIQGIIGIREKVLMVGVNWIPVPNK